MDVARYVFALEIMDQVKKDPGAFVFDKSFSMAQKSNRIGEDRPSEIDHDELRKSATTKGYFSLPKNSRKKNEILDLLIVELGLYRENKSTSKESKYRHLKRILKTQKPYLDI
ncbi:MAG: hypothetical protein WBJ68_13070 [Candidatus Dechloromonas phosphoritropha]|jgi:hypothetical protein|nr:hypothetical protein [Candidatus Dechloromonas phosphoritropha]